MDTRIDISPSRRVIVHIGAQKTGSTSFHHFVAKNRDALGARLDIRVPTKGTLTRALGRTCALYSLEPAAHEDDLVGLIRVLREDLRGDDKVCLISHENIIGAMMGRSGVTDLYPALPKIIALFETHLAPFAPEYVVYTRAMGAWKNSVYNQAVKSDGYTGTQDAFLQDTRDCRNWEALQADLEARLGADRVRFFALEDEHAPDRPGRQLLQFAGLSDDEIEALAPIEGRRNQSLNEGALEFMRQLNGLDVGRPARRQVAELIKTNQALFAVGSAPQQKA